MRTLDKLIRSQAKRMSMMNVASKVQRLVGEDAQSDNPATSALHPTGMKI